nr:curli assembly protein CsgF [uncultured Rhodopila sp.]
MIAAVLLMSFPAARAALATDQLYIMQSPNFGGVNASSLSAAQTAVSMVKQQEAAAAAATAAASAAANSPSQQFANSIISQLDAMVARNIAAQIAGALPGQGGTIQSGSTSISYTNVDGTLNVSITTPTGTTTLAMPSGN